MLKALLLTRDQEVLRVIRRVLETVSIDLETVTSTDAARQTIERRKLDAILIDCDDVQSGCDLIRELRKGKSNAKSIVFAITNRVTTVKDAFAIGANFVLDKPVSPDRAARSLRAAHGLILRERRRYHRHALQTTAHVSYGNLRDVPIPLSNISEGGVALATTRTADMTGSVSLRFELPGCNRSLEAKGEFVWTNDAGRVGVRFTTMPTSTKSALDSWLARQLDVSTPALMTVGR
ncbi:MAG TPA: PilZ domain-containing protein [Terriglobales bacterium]|nr:PilZ domain-containing protein [Terriglobales bacterium]